jgi:DNA-binding CsgD family transcriptional regulator
VRARAPLEGVGWNGDILVWARIHVALLAGRPKEALPLCDLLDTPGSRLRPFAQGTRAWALFELGRSVAGLEVTPMPTADIYWRYGLELRAMQALEADDPLEAVRLFTDAASAWEHLALPEELRCIWAAGHAAVVAGDLKDARARLAEVERRAQSAGLTALTLRTQRTLRAAGVRRSLPRADRSAPNSLSPREREILMLVGQGLTTAEAASRLGVQPATVDRVIRLAMSRLGARSRIQAAELAAASE